MTKYLFTAGVLGLVMTFATSANASLTLSLDDTIDSFTVLDNGPGDSNPLVGQIIFINGLLTNPDNLTGFAALTISTFSNAPGTLTDATLNTTQIDVTSSLAKTLDLVVSDTMFTLPGVTGDTLLAINQLTQNAGSQGSASATQTTELDGAPTPAAIVTGVGSDETSALLTRGGPTFTLETLVSASFSAGYSGSFTHISSAIIPEPISLAVWIGVFAVGALGISRRHRSA